MAKVGTVRYIYFRLADMDGEPVAGRTPSDLALTFTRNDAACADAVTIAENGGGRYHATYTPSSEGTDYIEIYDAATDVRVIDCEVIEISVGDQIAQSSQLVTLDEDSDPRLKQTDHITGFSLYVIPSSDWDAGHRTSLYAAGQTTLNPNGTWRSKISVIKGTYHIVLMSRTETYVLAPYLAV
jgi:hypothetical protein